MKHSTARRRRPASAVVAKPLFVSRNLEFLESEIDIAWLEQLHRHVALAISAYAMVGWTIGLGFTREVLVRSARLLPLLFGAIGALIALCGLLSCLLVVILKVDPLTAYLATSPGGVDAMLIIAASSDVDLPFILSAQTVRFLLIVAFGPPLVRAIVRRAR